MPSINEGKNYIKSSDLAEGQVIEFTNAGEWKTVDFSKAKDGSNKKQVFEIFVKHPNFSSPKSLILNSTSLNNLGTEYGTVTEEWVGKKAKVTFINMVAFGKMSKVLSLMPIK